MRLINYLLATMLLTAGCATSGGDETAPPVAVAPHPLVPPKPQEIPGGEMTPDQLAGRILLKEKSVRPGAKPRLSAVIENAQALEPVTLDLAARFLNSEGTVIRQTDWRRVTLQPGQSHQFLAESLEPAADIQLLMREITQATR